MKNRSFWSILLFAGMIIAAGVGFNSCEKSGGTSGGGGSSSGGGGGTVSDTLEHCWEVTFTYADYPDEVYTEHIWETKKKMEEAIAEAKKAGYYAKISYKESSAKTHGECDAMDVDENEKMCWKLTYTYKGESQSETWYEWATLKEVKEGVQEAEKAGNKLTYEMSYAEDKDACEEKNSQGGGGEPQVQTYYIKHPWGTGQDYSWEWRAFEYEEGVYYIYGEWGGVGANINTVPEDGGAMWIPEKDIYNSSSVSVGQSVVFEYNPKSQSLVVGAAY